MNEFDPIKVNTYTIQELADFVQSGCRKEDLYACGLSAPKRPQLDAELSARTSLVTEDDQRWSIAQKRDTIPAYIAYLDKYDNIDGYRGKYVKEAQTRLEELRIGLKDLSCELFEDMKAYPWKYNQNMMKQLFDGLSDEGDEGDGKANSNSNVGDIATRFLKSGQTITISDLKAEGIIPDYMTKDRICAPDSKLPQLSPAMQGDFPKDNRWDVYFVGVPRGGKSSVLSGIFYSMNKKGQISYIPHPNKEGQDLAGEYYNGLVESVEECKFPESTNGDSASYMKIDLTKDKRRNNLVFVELSGEVFAQAVQSGYVGKKAWTRLGGSMISDSSNDKVLFFIVDYGVKIGENKQAQQRRVLESMLSHVLTKDGPGQDGRKGCTMSKVKTVAVIVTKCDMMSCKNREERSLMAQQFLQDEFATFMKNLRDCCIEYGINKPIHNNVYVFDFSLGTRLVGNSCQYDSRDSARIVEFLSKTTAGKSTGLLGNLFG